MSEPRTEAGRDAIADIVGHPDHVICRTSEAGPVTEANCIIDGLSDRGFVVREAAAPQTLDVERLAEAMAVNGISDGDGLPLFDVAERIAVEYASTGGDTAGRTPCPICPHWLELHNPDGSCGCGMPCARPSRKEPDE